MRVEDNARRIVRLERGQPVEWRDRTITVQQAGFYCITTHRPAWWQRLMFWTHMAQAWSFAVQYLGHT